MEFFIFDQLFCKPSLVRSIRYNILYAVTVEIFKICEKTRSKKFGKSNFAKYFFYFIEQCRDLVEPTNQILNIPSSFLINFLWQKVPTANLENSSFKYKKTVSIFKKERNGRCTE